MTHRYRAILTGAVVAALGAVAVLSRGPASWPSASGGGASAPTDRGASPTIGASVQAVDSIFPIEEELRRFRADLVEVPTALAEGAASRDELVARYLGALETADTSELARLVLTRAEFPYLYYPFTQYARPPYELGPALLWFQMQNQSSRGLARALRLYAESGAPPRHAGYGCESEPQMQERNRIWSDCVVELRMAKGDTVPQRLFGSIVERDGRYKLVTFANGL